MCLLVIEAVSESIPPLFSCLLCAKAIVVMVAFAIHVVDAVADVAFVAGLMVLLLSLAVVSVMAVTVVGCYCRWLLLSLV